MSAAATAAGYLYASGRLRGRNGREEETAREPEQKAKRHVEQGRELPRRKEVKVAVYEPAEERAAAPVVTQPKALPKIQYRTRRWKPE
jgi:hypothetical protein